MILETWQQKFGQIWVIQSRETIFQRFHEFCVCRPLRWHSSNFCDVTTVQLSNGTVQKKKNKKKILFIKMYLPSTFILKYVRAEMNVHAFMNELDQKDYWYPRKIKKLWKSMYKFQWRVVLLWYHIFWQSFTQRGRHTQLWIITSLKMDYPNLLKPLLLRL